MSNKLILFVFIFTSNNLNYYSSVLHIDLFMAFGNLYVINMVKVMAMFVLTMFVMMSD